MKIVLTDEPASRNLDSSSSRWWPSLWMTHHSSQQPACGSNSVCQHAHC